MEYHGIAQGRLPGASQRWGPRLKFDKHTDMKAIPALPSAGKADEIIFDTSLPGFGLRLRASGARSWIVQYRSRGRTRRAMLGPFVKLKPAQARQAAERFFAEVLLGGDPQARKEKDRREQTRSMISVANLFIDARQHELRKATMKEHRRYLLDPVYFGKLHRAGISTIMRADVAAAVTRIANTNGRVTAARARSSLSGMYAWAIGEGIIIDGINPVVGSNRPKAPPPRDRVLSDAEIMAIWKNCEGEFGEIIKLLLATGCRRSEIGGLRHTEVDLINETLTIPALRSKNKNPLVVPLSSLAREVYEAIPRKPGRDLVFEGNDNGFIEWHRPKLELDARAGDGVLPYRLHDLRRTFATGLGKHCHVLPHVIECLLGHRGGFKSGVAGVYNRSDYMPEMRTAAELWADRIRALVTGEPRKVVALEQRTA